MKKSILTLAAAAFILSGFTFISCETTKNTGSSSAPASADSYSDDASEDSSNTTTKSKNKKKPLISFGNTGKFILTDTINFYLPSGIGKVSQKPATITLDSKNKTAGFGAQVLLGYYIVQFDENAIKYYNQALASYLKDFENKKLDRKSNKSFRQYGSKEMKLFWGSMKTSTPNNSNTKCFFGYDFIDGSPYFEITVVPGINNYFLLMNQDRDFAEPENAEVKFYFTKAQAAVLADHLSAEYLNEVFTEYELSLTGGEIMEADSDYDNDYAEADAEVTVEETPAEVEAE